jgi:hypothetical protein
LSATFSASSSVRSFATCSGESVTACRPTDYCYNVHRLLRPVNLDQKQY